MKFSLKWLNDHLDLSDHSLEDLDSLLTFAGVEVEGIQSLGVSIENLVVGKILSSEKHPDADKLSVCKVDDGSGEPRQIVCGAKNYKVGDNVPLALPGCTLGEGFTIKSGKLRGVESHGMLCAASEIGLVDKEEGLLILDSDAKPGTPVGDLFEDDTLLELEVTPNRPDLLSHLGMARETAALTGKTLKGVIAHNQSTTATTKAGDAQIKISAPDSCPFYTGRWIRGVKVAPSPAWLCEKLEAIGLRPINNIVDITNYVLMEMGQPLHAFDLAKLDGGIDVRLAAEGEKFLALDGETYPLEASDLVIADASKALAIGGVMGGEDSGVTDTTTDVLLEAAYFTPSVVRRTSRRLTLHSDSSYRFERGVDPSQVAGASDLATKLILELAGGTADDELVVCGEAPATLPPVTLQREAVRDLMGHPIDDSEIDRILSSLGLELDSAGGDTWTIPGYRLDLQRPVDLIEEVARVFGFDPLESRTVARFSPASKADALYDFTRHLQLRLAGLGFSECRHIKLISDQQLADDVATQHRGMSEVRLKNPLNDEQNIMRPGLIPGLLATAERNVRMGNSSLRLFEIGRVFTMTPKGDEIEHEHVGLLVSGGTTQRSWHDPRPADLGLFDLRGALENLAAPAALTLHPVDDPRLMLASQIEIGGQKKLGLIGVLPPARARELGIDAPVIVAELNLKKLSAALCTGVTAEPLPRFPAISRDIALEAPVELSNLEIANFFHKASSQEALLVASEMFDRFVDPSGEKLATDRKSITWSLTYRSPDRTLESAEVDAAHQKILEKLKKALPVEFR